MAVVARQAKPIILLSALAIFALQIGVGIYAVYLSELFYSKFGPFYDSLAYFNGIAEMSSAAQSEGRLTALFEQARRSTVFYPWLVFAGFAGKVQLDRNIAVYIQILASTLMQFALFTYFYRQRRDGPAALAYSSVFVGIAALFWYNGGISDFRMDLIQYFFYATVMALYLTARRMEARLWWVVLGISVGLLCLARATSPIYLMLLFAVLAPADILTAQRYRRDVLVGWCLAAVTAIPIAGWFYATNLKSLYYYYFIWNLDANARLPMMQSAKHISFTFGHIGAWLAGALLLRGGVTVVAGVRQSGIRALVCINWRALWFSVVPVGFLVLAGAGLNPFVSMLGVAGLLMFLLEPLAPAATSIRRPLELALIALVLAGVALNVASGVGNHSRDDRVSDWIPRHDGLQQLTLAMIDEMGARGPQEYRYAVAHVGALTADAVFHRLAFDEKFPTKPHATVAYGSATLAKYYQGSATALEWTTINGTSDDERIDRLVELLNRECDFFVMADTESQLLSWPYINRFIPEINRRLLLAGAWQRVTRSLPVSPNERVILLRNRARDTNAYASR